ncbi:MAG: type I-C CRISPR-associated protein Cas8c/Csd1, partial [Ignavibacterium sp.]|nr:type I-C CRISPR-associated protein Cas8c/Csd1 [Ignavibacterium sp.]
MILKALYDYYERKASDPKSHIAPEGWEWKEIPYVIVINNEGKFVAIEDTREGEGKKKRAKKFLVPQTVKRTVGKKANLLWDNIEYALGANPRNRDDVEERFNLFINRIKEEIVIDEFPNVSFLLKFLESNPVKQIESSGYSEIWNQILEENPFIVFRIDGQTHNCICDDLSGKPKEKSNKKGKGVCLITGDIDTEVERLHPAIKGVRGGNTQGGALISFNLPAFNSYGKTQNFNAPIGKRAAFAYTTALNTLLGKDSANKITIADSTIVFWSEKKLEGIDPEEIFPWVIAMQKNDSDNPDRGVEKIEKLFDSIFTGKYSQAKTNHFYVLGLSPNAARISVRFWKAPSVEDFGLNIKKHFDDFDIIRGPKDSKYMSLYQILSATALQYKMENVPPNLAGAVIESIIDGTPYPTSLLQQCIRRIRAEQNVNRTRAAILKAYLNRFNKIHKPNEKEITMSLDPNNTNVAYRIGRLFAVLEIIQEKSALAFEEKLTSFKAEIEEATQNNQKKEVNLQVTEKEINSKLSKELAKAKASPDGKPIIEKMIVNLRNSNGGEFVIYAELEVPGINAKVGLIGQIEMVNDKPRLVVTDLNLGKLPLPKSINRRAEQL